MSNAIKKLRAQLGQVSWVAREFRKAGKPRKQWVAIRSLTVPKLRRTGIPGELWGISVVRDELDVLPSVVSHMFSQGVDRLLIADNRSTDGTREWLQERSTQDPRLAVALDENPAHTQSEKMTWLAHQAWRAGAEWIINFDADEFWFAEGESLREFFNHQSAGIIHANFHHMVPVSANPEPLTESEFVMDMTPSFPGKTAMRAHPIAVVGPGNHYCCRIGGETNGLFIAHAQYRGPKQIARKFRQGVEAARLTNEDLGWFSPHWEAGAALDDAMIEQVFERMAQGLPEPLVKYEAKGPMIKCQPLTWPSWQRLGVEA